MSDHDRILLVLCAPWVVAIPITAVVRVVTTGDLPLRHAPTTGALLGTLDDGGVQRAAWDLGHLLGTHGNDHAWVMLSVPMPVALRTGPCLSVVVAPASCPLPAILTARSFGLGCFVLPSLPLPSMTQAELAPVGLRLDPIRLFNDAEMLAAQRMSAVGMGLHTVGIP